MESLYKFILHLSFQWDYVFLRVSLMKGVLRLWKKGKLSPLYIGPYEILAIVGAISYCLALPLDLSS